MERERNKEYLRDWEGQISLTITVKQGTHKKNEF